MFLNNENNYNEKWIMKLYSIIKKIAEYNIYKNI